MTSVFSIGDMDRSTEASLKKLPDEIEITVSEPQMKSRGWIAEKSVHEYGAILKGLGGFKSMTIAYSDKFARWIISLSRAEPTPPVPPVEAASAPIPATVAASDRSSSEQ